MPWEIGALGPDTNGEAPWETARGGVEWPSEWEGTVNSALEAGKAPGDTRCWRDYVSQRSFGQQ